MSTLVVTVVFTAVLAMLVLELVVVFMVVFTQALAVLVLVLIVASMVVSMLMLNSGSVDSVHSDGSSVDASVDSGDESSIDTSVE